MRQQIFELDEIDPDAPKGSKPWLLAIIQKTKMSLSEFDSEIRLTQTFLSTLQKYKAWEKFGLLSFEVLCKEKLGISEEQAQSILKAKPGEITGAVLGKRGRPKKSDPIKGRNPTIIKRGRDYDIARLDRDRPDMAAKVRAGEISPNKAMIQAGLKKAHKSKEAEVAYIKRTFSASDIRWIKDQL